MLSTEINIKELTIEKLDEILVYFFKNRKPIPQQDIDNVYKNMSPALIEYFSSLVESEAKKSTIKPWHVKKIKITNNKKRI